MLIKCNHTDASNAKVFQERAKMFGKKNVDSVVGLQIQGTRAMEKCSAVSISQKILYIAHNIM